MSTSQVNTNLAREAAQQSGVDLMACYQCEKCTNGCPVTFAMDEPPHAVIRMLQMGLGGEVAQSRTPWVCASCETCFTRCPNQIDIPRLMDWLKRQALADGQSHVEQSVADFHAAFLNNVKKYGRVNETAFMGALQFKTIMGEKGLDMDQAMGNLKLGMKMLSRGRLSLLPKKVEAKDRVRKLF